MANYVYPAIFTPEDGGAYSVDFPDLESCYTCGDTLAEAVYMAADVLAFTLCDYEREKRPIPVPSSRDAIKTERGEFINLIACDTLEYQKQNNARAVTKTVSIPEWLDEVAMEANIDFSQILQDALKEKLNIA